MDLLHLEARDDHDIWRTVGPIGRYERVTYGGAETRAWESADGMGVFYKRRQSIHRCTFSRCRVARRAPMIACVTCSRFSVVPHGIYYVPCQPHGSGNRDMPVRVLNPVTGEDRQVAALEMSFPLRVPDIGSFAVSPDGQTILYSRLVSNGADLMLIENFR